MKVDKKTLLVSDFSSAEKASMLQWCKDVVLEGNVPHPNPAWLDTYLPIFYERMMFSDGCGMGSQGEPTPQPPEGTPNYLLILSTVIPQKIMLSLLLDDGQPVVAGYTYRQTM